MTSTTFAPCRMTTIPETVSPLPVEVGHAPAHFRPERDVADILHADDCEFRRP